MRPTPFVSMHCDSQAAIAKAKSKNKLDGFTYMRVEVGPLPWELRQILLRSYEYLGRAHGLFVPTRFVQLIVKLRKPMWIKVPWVTSRNTGSRNLFSPCFVIQYLFVLKLVHNLWALVLMHWVLFSSKKNRVYTLWGTIRRV